jgi:hypothetical protein
MYKALTCLFALLANFTLFADAKALGESLEREMRGYVKDKKWDKLEGMIAPYFQAILFDGARSKEQFIARAKTLNVTEDNLDNFKVTENGDLIVISYTSNISETINGQKTSSSGYRMSTWQKVNDKYQMDRSCSYYPYSH